MAVTAAELTRSQGRLCFNGGSRGAPGVPGTCPGRRRRGRPCGRHRRGRRHRPALWALARSRRLVPSPLSEGLPGLDTHFHGAWWPWAGSSPRGPLPGPVRVLVTRQPASPTEGEHRARREPSALRTQPHRPLCNVPLVTRASPLHAENSPLSVRGPLSLVSSFGRIRCGFEPSPLNPALVN